MWQFILSIFPRSQAARIATMMSLAFVAGIGTTWIVVETYLVRRNEITIAEMTGGRLSQIIEQCIETATFNENSCNSEEQPYSFQMLDSFPKETDSYMSPLILTLNEKRIRAAVRFTATPPLPGLLSAKRHSTSLQEDSIYNPTLQSQGGDQFPNATIPAAVRMSSLSQAIARQDIDATLYIFGENDQVMAISSPKLWRVRVSETQGAFMTLFLAVLILSVSYPFSNTLMAPFRKLSNGTKFTRKSLGRFTPTEALAIQDNMREMVKRFDRDRERQLLGLAAISHDLRTPVTRMLLRTEMIKEDDIRERFANDLDSIHDLVEGALDFLSLHKNNEERHRFSLSSLITSLCDDYQDMELNVTFDSTQPIEIEGVASVFSVAASVELSTLTQGFMIGRPKQLRRALSNIIDNALKYGNYAKVSLGYDGSERTVITIVDGGPGIPSDQIEKVFLPFERGHEGHKTKGVGLGLSIANEIIRNHKGEMTLTNSNEGLRVEIKLPRDIFTN
ncbi:ATP-binding protein [uncultured Cohaesibacter sp.]|uniref:sensor histidine kinase n=1 Tax=uncultured Cohaesibacter sp. TaxID=1002546 RepID=UPI0029C8B58B|nr:ATP-binding protein [uncultured Cohaesibacter sp.]